MGAMRMDPPALLVSTIVLALGLPAATFAQRYRATDDIPRYEEYLREALPGAETFRFVDRGTPHYRGYRTGRDGEETLVGLGFFTVDFAPKVRGYKGEIWMLIGMDPGGTLLDPLRGAGTAPGQVFGRPSRKRYQPLR